MNDEMKETRESWEESHPWLSNQTKQEVVSIIFRTFSQSTPGRNCQMIFQDSQSQLCGNLAVATAKGASLWRLDFDRLPGGWYTKAGDGNLDYRF